MITVSTTITIGAFRLGLSIGVRSWVAHAAFRHVQYICKPTLGTRDTFRHSRLVAVVPEIARLALCLPSSAGEPTGTALLTSQQGRRGVEILTFSTTSALRRARAISDVTTGARCAAFCSHCGNHIDRTVVALRQSCDVAKSTTVAIHARVGPLHIRKAAFVAFAAMFGSFLCGVIPSTAWLAF